MTDRSGRSALRAIIRRHYKAIPAVALIGVLASALEGAGIGLVIPLLSVVMPNSVATGLPEPLKVVGRLLVGFSPEARLLILGGAILGLIALKNAVQAANAYLVARVDNTIARDIRNALASRLLSLEHRFFVEQDPNRLSRIIGKDCWHTAEAVRWAGALLPATATVLVFCALLAWLNPVLFLFVLGGAALVQLVVSLFERRQRVAGDRVTRSDHVIWARMTTLVSAHRVLRLFGQRQREEQRFGAASDDLKESLAASRTVTALSGPVLETIVAALFIMLILVSYRTGMTLPEVTTFLLLLTRIQPAAAIIRQSQIGIASVRGSVREVEWLLGQEPAIRSAATAGAPVLELDRPISFRGVSFTYPSGTVALEDVSFTIKPGAITALIGKSGSGKTTIVNLLCRLLEPDSGLIRLGNIAARAIDQDQWRSRIALAGQDLELVEGTIAENIAYGRTDASPDEIEEAALVAGATAFIAALPQGIETSVGQFGINLSGGQRQRIGLARALVRKPDLLILDEATNAVDALTEMEIIRLLKQHLFFRSALVISHRRSTLAACEEGIVLTDGRVSEAGPLAGLAYLKTMTGSAEAAA
ncbi:MAG: ABC transporter ATP-binding protein [Sphingomicrobium sp.]